VAAIGAAPSWGDRSAATRLLLERLLGGERTWATWPEHEADAARRIDAALARLVVLDEVEPRPTDAAFRLAVAAELDAPTGRVGRFGQGVLVAPLAAAIGLDLDAVFVLGMAEGTCPRSGATTRCCPTTSAPARWPASSPPASSGCRPAPVPARRARRRRRPAHPAVPPRRPARPADRLASRWLLDSAAAHLGAALFSSDMEHLGPPSSRRSTPSPPASSTPEPRCRLRA
jgi:hypothetical protein